ncbi:hypothetical protein [Entomospira culicis]|uniref:Uncharacterized protein n=1 Tax=Entomospira culicis TaxID=2719989 RepID=A0A968KU55_9SPIO|nr:hypothetical protein [Entomospira culicis]NIZ18954.1 hypothetical protein [Entomospira culicis]NIZ69169.1 hypothetical protein [Entomospira culicis]WDI37756.1 hypothetical protein PVA46_02940 [Entomospira culicis]WDI39384.1 hypothetical protein PVA47_02945 [Entomospira culicis]
MVRWRYLLSAIFLTMNIAYALEQRVAPHYVQTFVWVNTELLSPAVERDIWWVATRYSQEFIDSLAPEEETHFYAILSLFEEARWILSGMVYGLWFEYTPSSREHQVSEEFLLQHIELIKLGDKNMRLVSVATSGSWLGLTFEYALSSEQYRYMQQKERLGATHARGSARSELHFGFDSRKVAIEESIKNAIFLKLRTLYRTRPHRVSGELVLREPTLIDIKEGNWYAKSDIAMRVRRVEF